MMYDVEHFHVFICHNDFFGELQDLWPLLKLGCLFSYYWVFRVLYTLWIMVLYQICLLQIYSLILGLVFSFSCNCLLQTEFWILMKLTITSFINRGFSVISKKAWPYPKSSRFYPMLSSGSFTVLLFHFRSVIHFRLIFIKNVKSASRFIFACECPVITAPFSKKTIFASFYYCFALSKINWLYWYRSISGFSNLFHWSICLFLCQCHPVLITVGLLYILNLGNVGPSNLTLRILNLRCLINCRYRCQKKQLVWEFEFGGGNCRLINLLH